MTKRERVQAVAEVAGAKLGDARRTARVERMMTRLAEQPGASIPQAMITSAELEGAYGLLEHEDVRPRDLLEVHVERTLARCAARQRVYLVNDTTTFGFGGLSLREGLGRLNDGGQGFMGHFCIAVTPERMMLGVVGFEALTRSGPVKSRREKNRKKPDRESLRWMRVADEVAEKVDGTCDAVHVMDSEADDYELFCFLVERGQQFIIRAAQDRRVVDEDGRLLFDALGTASHRFERDVPLSERREKETKSRSKRNQPRRARTARLEIRTKTITVRRPANVSTRGLPDSLTLNFVHVREVEPPAGEEPVDWLLVTNEPIRTRKQVAAVVDGYRARWVVEEFFKALKTGCGFEKAQLESRDALVRFLVMLMPIAWQLLVVRSLLADSPDAPASSFFTEAQMRAVRLLHEQKLPARPAIEDIVPAIASLGGHIKHNGPPGWLVLGRGMRRVNEAALLISRLKNGRRSNQS